MHELSLAQALLEQVRAAAREHGSPRVLAVQVRVGEFAGADPEALRFAFAALREEYGCAGAELAIEKVPARRRCPACGVGQTVRGEGGVLAAANCPRCGGATELVMGRELELLALDVEES